jgi:hypothetical protein
MTGAYAAPSLAVALVTRGEGKARKERQVFSVEHRSGEPPSCVGTSLEETPGHRPEAPHGQVNLPSRDGFSTASPTGDPDPAGSLE